MLGGDLNRLVSYETSTAYQYRLSLTCRARTPCTEEPWHHKVAIIGSEQDDKLLNFPTSRFVCQAIGLFEHQWTALLTATSSKRNYCVGTAPGSECRVTWRPGELVESMVSILAFL